MVIRSCPRCHTSKLQISGSFVETRPLPDWLQPRALLILVVGLGGVGGLVASLNSFLPGVPTAPLYLPWLFILVAAITGGIWHKLRMRYGYLLYRVQCQASGTSGRLRIAVLPLAQHR
jgi:hypothetical protein